MSFQNVKCPDCGSYMVLRCTLKMTYNNGKPRKFWGCSRYPLCSSTHGAHPDGTPLGIPGDKATKLARIEAHQAFDNLWKNGRCTRDEAYTELSKLMGLNKDDTHFARFTLQQCKTATELLIKAQGRKLCLI